MTRLLWWMPKTCPVSDPATPSRNTAPTCQSWRRVSPKPPCISAAWSAGWNAKATSTMVIPCACCCHLASCIVINEAKGDAHARYRQHSRGLAGGGRQFYIGAGPAAAPNDRGAAPGNSYRRDDSTGGTYPDRRL